MQSELSIRSNSQLFRPLAFAAGGALILGGLLKRSWGGALWAAAGGGLIYTGVAGAPAIQFWKRRGPVSVERSITVMAIPEQLMEFWSEPKNLPQLIPALDSAEKHADGFWIFHTQDPLGRRFSWRAQFSESAKSNLRWLAKEDSHLSALIELQFSPAENGRGTTITCRVNYHPLAGKLGAALASAIGRSTEQMVRETLRRSKQLIETGEIATTEGQPSGPRSRAFHLFYRLNPSRHTSKNKIARFPERRSA